MTSALRVDAQHLASFNKFRMIDLTDWKSSKLDLRKERRRVGGGLIREEVGMGAIGLS